MSAPRWRRLLVQSLLAVAATFVAVVLLQLAWWPTQKLFKFPYNWLQGRTGDNDLPAALLFLAACCLACFLMLRFLAPRNDRVAAPLPVKLREAAIGAALGGGQILFDIGVLAALGAYHLRGVGDPTPMLVGLLTMIGVGAIEEGALRGVMLPHVERLLGPWWALLLTSLLFGIGHLFNPNASALAALAIALEAGFALGGLYLLTRRMWAPIAMHAAWNWVCGPVLGVPLSGTVPPSWVQAEVTGPAWLTGGGFGPEASVIEMAAGAVIAAGIIWVWRKRQMAISRPAHSISVTPAS
jgi:membrane protease YdiL (CAAX protease family)